MDCIGIPMDSVGVDRLLKLRFSTPLRDYRDFGPLHLAGYGEARWHLPDGVFTYGEFTRVDIAMNVH